MDSFNACIVVVAFLVVVFLTGSEKYKLDTGVELQNTSLRITLKVMTVTTL